MYRQALTNSNLSLYNQETEIIEPPIQMPIQSLQSQNI